LRHCSIANLHFTNVLNIKNNNTDRQTDRQRDAHLDRETGRQTDHHVYEAGEAPESINFILHYNEYRS